MIDRAGWTAVKVTIAAVSGADGVRPAADVGETYVATPPLSVAMKVIDCPNMDRFGAEAWLVVVLAVLTMCK